ncbi:MAG: hypothetical protein KDN05_03800 [Verrucomicrobiae bacterium]|nr:hypothetical protein [Verrucomicrobiae bacterium]MCP5533499.1 hypothetical protein [Akkermansiaceae bacterium]MCP5544490.1 hypothetical protein [Akkermansiaceae bacterium]MCP5546458.1 hypothetical protein [Akkermansiaceae bacterium]
MKARMREEFGRSSQTLKAATAEPVFSWIKDTLVFRRFQPRGRAASR